MLAVQSWTLSAFIGVPFDKLRTGIVG